MQKIKEFEVLLVDDPQDPTPSQEPDVEVVEILRIVLIEQVFRVLVLACYTLHASFVMNYF